MCGILTHWGRVTHICVGKLTIIGSDNGLSPARRQAIIWTSAGILLIWTLGTNFSEISIGIQIQTLSFKKIHLEMSSAKWRPFCLGLNVLIYGQKSIILLHLSAWQQATDLHDCHTLCIPWFPQTVLTAVWLVSNGVYDKQSWHVYACVCWIIQISSDIHCE